MSKTLYYVPIQEELKSTELGCYSSYGLSVLLDEKEIDFVSDISQNAETVCRLAEICNEKQLSPIHLKEVIDDFLAEGNVSLL